MPSLTNRAGLPIAFDFQFHLVTDLCPVDGIDQIFHRTEVRAVDLGDYVTSSHHPLAPDRDRGVTGLDSGLGGGAVLRRFLNEDAGVGSEVERVWRCSLIVAPLIPR